MKLVTCLALIIPITSAIIMIREYKRSDYKLQYYFGITGGEKCHFK